MNRDQFLSYFFITLFLLVFSQVLWILSSFFQSIFWSIVLAYAFYPLYQLLFRLFRKNQNWAALVSTLLLFLAIMPIVIVLTLNLVKEALDLYRLVSVHLNEQGFNALIDKVRHIPLVHKLELEFGHLEIIRKNLETWALEASLNIGEWIAKQAGAAFKNAVIVSVNFLLTFFLLFFFFRDGAKIYDFIHKITPLEKRSKEHVYSKLSETFAAVIRGQLLTSAAQAFMAGLAFWMLGVKLPIFLGIATFIGSLIPVVGASCVWVPVTIFLAITGHTIHLPFYETLSIPSWILLLVWGILGISLIDNILKPVIIGEKTKLPYFLLFLAILGGVNVYGVVGAFLAPMILSIFFALIQIYREKYL